MFSSEGLTKEESIFALIQVADRIHFFVARGFSTWLLVGCGLEATIRL